MAAYGLCTSKGRHCWDITTSFLLTVRIGKEATSGHTGFPALLTAPPDCLMRIGFMRRKAPTFCQAFTSRSSPLHT